ncbi:Uncharacterised protein [Mycobacteroides abscessus subsp. massiliense]|nr:Uncharacterised protein [Mycobacteroides abscessus subsp. massiliense]
MPMMKPASTIDCRFPISRPNIDAAKMTPAEVITPPVDLTVLMTPERIPSGDSSRMREMNNRL